MSPTTSLSPPPTSDQQLPDQPQVTGAGSGSGYDKFRSVISRLTGGGTPMIDKSLEEAHQKRLADADLNLQNYKALSSILTKGVDPKTGEPLHDAQGNLTPAGQKYELQRQTAFQAYNKAAGVNKESKSVIQKIGQVTDHLVHHRKAGAQGQPPAGGLTPPPTATPAGAAPTATAAQMPALPSPTPTQSADDPRTLVAMGERRQQQTDLDAASQRKIAEGEKDPKQIYDSLLKIGFSDQEAKKIIAEKVGGAAARTKPHPILYTDPNDPTRKLFGTQDVMTGQVFDQNGDPVPNAGQITPAMLPTSRTGEMPVFNPVTNQFEQQPTYGSTQKVVPKSKSGGLAAPPARTGGGGGSARVTPSASGRHGVPARQFNILQKQATSIDEARNSLIGDDPNQVGGLTGDLSVFKDPKSVDRLANYLGLVTSTVENEAKQVTGQGPMAAAEWYLQLPQTVVGLQQGALADASRGLDDGAPDGPEHRFVADYFRTMGTIGGLRASTGASAARWSFNTLRSELPTPGPVTSYPEALRRVKNIVQETNVVAKRNPLATKVDPTRLDNVDKPKSKRPLGATHTGRGSADHKLHWLDANQHDLGLVEE